MRADDGVAVKPNGIKHSDSHSVKNVERGQQEKAVDEVFAETLWGNWFTSITKIESDHQRNFR